ncbi:MAG: hypothetical protein IJJ19_00270 [Erysipelotrichaceae bacterium]|nr:hypothetical protein [Erysipelotrichaceae bacterium]
MKVLFVGNSHTFFNDMPELFARFVEKTTGEKPEVVMLAYGGRDYKWHRKEYFAIRFNLMYGNYDYCVLQQAAHPYPPKEETLEYGGMLIELCKKYGVKPVIYMTWAEKRFPENQQKMIDTCKQLAKEHDALLAPVGRVWQKVQQSHPEIELYFKDGEHAGPYGDFLIASVFCKLLTGKLSEEVTGCGFDFLQDEKMNMELATVIEEKDRIPVELDRNKTEIIIRTVNEEM